MKKAHKGKLFHLNIGSIIMAKTILGGPVILPGIEEQIEYAKHLRKVIIPCIEQLQSGIDKILAIEQTLIAAMVNDKVSEKGVSIASSGHAAIANQDFKLHNQVIDILNSIAIKATSARVEVLKVIHSKGKEEFTASDILNTISRRKRISKTSVGTSILLFKKMNLIEEMKGADQGTDKRAGKRETKYISKVTFKNFSRRQSS